MYRVHATLAMGDDMELEPVQGVGHMKPPKEDSPSQEGHLEREMLMPTPPNNMFGSGPG